MGARQWYVHVSYPAGDYGPELTDDQADRLASVAHDGGPVTVDGDRGRVTFTRTVEAGTIQVAIRDAIGETVRSARALGLDRRPVAVHVEPWADGPGRVSLAPLGLVGMAEIAELLGVSRQRAFEVARLPGFPEPVERLASGAIYDRASVQRFAASWERRPGRPRKQTA